MRDILKFTKRVLWKLGLYDEEKIFLSDLEERERGVVNYSKSRIIWERKTVHSRLDDAYFIEEAEYVAEQLKLEKNDVLLSIGCGDGRLDTWLLERCKSVLGFDFAEQKIVEAQKRNSEAIYWRQSFLENIHLRISEADKGYSMSVMQYCAADDLFKFFEIQYKACEAYHIKEIIHFSVPDKSKAENWYKNFSKEVVDKYREQLNVIFPEDGSYWHDMDKVKICAERAGFKVEIKASNCDYRSNVCLKL